MQEIAIATATAAAKTATSEAAKPETVWIRSGHEEPPFQVHGVYSIGNAGGYEVEISEDGETARLRTCFGHPHPEVSDWLPIVDVNDPADEDAETLHVIDPEELYIPLTAVMRV